MSLSAIDDDHQPFQYRPLPSTKHIRFLLLQPLKRFGDPIYADVEEAHITEAPSYQALSYSWGMNEDGDASLCRTITVEGATLAVTRNLYEGLQRLLSECRQGGCYLGPTTSPLRLWVDAVCINQQDPQEQSSQVAMMAKIYNNARKTLVWLGEGRDDDDLQTSLLFQRLPTDRDAISQNEVMHSLIANGVGQCRLYYRGTSAFCRCGQPVFLVASHQAWGQEWDRALSFKMLSEDRALLRQLIRRYVTLSRFITRRYWNRRWILQETRHSRALSLHWNEFQISPGMLEKISDDLQDILRQFGGVLQRFKNDIVRLWPRLHDEIVGSMLSRAGISLEGRFWRITRILSRSALYQEPSEQVLGKLLIQFQDMECSDPRDRLFSMFSLAPLHWIKPDYHQSTVQTYIAFAKGFIRRGGANMLLGNVNRFSPADEISEHLPSWVPDFRDTFDNIHADGFLPYRFRVSFDVHGSLEATFRFRGTVENFSCLTKEFTVVTRTPWLGMFARQKRLGRKTSHEARITEVGNMWLEKMQPPCPLRDGDVICTILGTRSVSHAENVLLFLRRVNSNENSYRIVCSLNRYDFHAGFLDWLSEGGLPSKIKVRLV